MNADLTLREMLGKSAEDSLDDLSENEIVDLAVRFAIWPATESYVSAPWLARFALRRQRHRIDERAPGEKRDLWGMPDESGFFADDNSVVVGLYSVSVLLFSCISVNRLISLLFTFWDWLLTF